MGFFSTLLGIIGFVFGLPLGLLVGFFLFIYSPPSDVQDPVIKPLHELEKATLQDLLDDLPIWIKSPDYERVDWFNKLISDMWPYLNKTICSIVESTAEPIFKEYIGLYGIDSIKFKKLSPGTLPPTFSGMKVFETNERELVMEPAMKWAGNPDIVLVIKLLSIPITVQLVDLQIFAAPRIALKPLVSAFPCFANIVVSLIGKPHIDFGLKVLGGDIMAIPGLYRFTGAPEMIKKQVANLYLWPRTLDIPILDASTIAVLKPVGILHVKVVRAVKLMKMDLLGLSDPYVKLGLSEDSMPAKKTTVKMKTLNPEWNEDFKMIVKDPHSQFLQLSVYDWDHVGGHDRLGMQIVPLKHLVPYEMKEFTLELLKTTNFIDEQSHNKKKRGQLVLEMTFVPFKEAESPTFSGAVDKCGKMESATRAAYSDEALNAVNGAGLLLVTIQGAEDVEGERHNNPYAVVLFRGEKRKTKAIRKTHHPLWNEEFEFMLEEPPVGEKIHIEVASKCKGLKRFSFWSKEQLGYVEINLRDVVHNERINEKYHLINSQNGIIHVEIRWKTV